MPIYEYKCPSCGQVSEVLIHSFFSPPGPRCPDCGHDMERRLSSPALVMEKANHSDATCCGREERCEHPPCSTGERCHRH
jgi:putative FmdB family regulatory protein